MLLSMSRNQKTLESWDLNPLAPTNLTFDPLDPNRTPAQVPKDAYQVDVGGTQSLQTWRRHGRISGWRA